MKEQIVEIIANGIKVPAEELMEKGNIPESWDSLIRVEILFEIEDSFDICFDSEELVSISTPVKLLNATLAKLEA